MNSEKVKEIKKALEFNANEDFCFLPYIDDKDKQNTIKFADILTLINELESELEKEQINNLNCDTELQYKEKRIAELEKKVCGNEELHTLVEKLNYMIILKKFAEKVAKRLININGIKQILDETLKEYLNES